MLSTARAHAGQGSAPSSALKARLDVARTGVIRLRQRAQREAILAGPIGPLIDRVRLYATHATGENTRSSKSSQSEAAPNNGAPSAGKYHLPEAFGPVKTPPRLSQFRSPDPSEQFKQWEVLKRRMKMQESELEVVKGYMGAWTNDLADDMRRFTLRTPDMAPDPKLERDEPYRPLPNHPGRSSLTYKQKLIDDKNKEAGERYDFDVYHHGARPQPRPNGPIQEDFMDGTTRGVERWNRYLQIRARFEKVLGKEFTPEKWESYQKSRRERAEAEARAKQAARAAQAARPAKEGAAGAAASSAGAAGGAGGGGAKAAPGSGPKPGASEKPAAAKPGAGEADKKPAAGGAGAKPEAGGAGKASASAGTGPSSSKTGAAAGAAAGGAASGGGGASGGGSKPAAAGAAGEAPEPGNEGAEARKMDPDEEKWEKWAREAQKALDELDPEARAALENMDELKDPIDEWLAVMQYETVEQEQRAYPAAPRILLEQTREMDKHFGAPDLDEKAREQVRKLTPDWITQEGERRDDVMIDNALGEEIERRAEHRQPERESKYQTLVRDMDRRMSELRRYQEANELSGEMKQFDEEIRTWRDKFHKWLVDFTPKPVTSAFEKLLFVPLRLIALGTALPYFMIRGLFRPKKYVIPDRDIWQPPASAYINPLVAMRFWLLRHATLEQRETRLLEKLGLERNPNQLAPFAGMDYAKVVSTILLKDDAVLAVPPRAGLLNPLVRGLHTAVSRIDASVAAHEAHIASYGGKAPPLFPPGPPEWKNRNAYDVLSDALLPPDTPDAIKHNDFWHPRRFVPGQESMTWAHFQKETLEADKKKALDEAAAKLEQDRQAAEAAVAAMEAQLKEEAEEAARAAREEGGEERTSAAPETAAEAAPKAEETAKPDAAPGEGAQAPEAEAAKKKAEEDKKAAEEEEAAKKAAEEKRKAEAEEKRKAEEEAKKGPAEVVIFNPFRNQEVPDHSLSSLWTIGRRTYGQSLLRWTWMCWNDWLVAERGVPGGVRFSTYLLARGGAENPEKLWAEEEAYHYEKQFLSGGRWASYMLYPETFAVTPYQEVHWRDFNNVLWMRGVEICKKYPALGANFFDIRRNLKPVLTDYFRGIHLFDPEMAGKHSIPQHIDHMFLTKEELDASTPPANGPIVHIMNQTLIRRVFKISIKSLAEWNKIILMSLTCVVRTRPWMRNMETGETLYGGPKRRAVFKYFLKLAAFPKVDQPGEFTWKVIDCELIKGKSRRRKKKRKSSANIRYRRFQ